MLKHACTIKLSSVTFEARVLCRQVACFRNWIRGITVLNKHDRTCFQRQSAYSGKGKEFDSSKHSGKSAIRKNQKMRA